MLSLFIVPAWLKLTFSCISQLAVVKGLVIDRVQKLKSGKAVLGRRICRASYGIEMSVRYNKDEHIGRSVYRDLDGELWVKGQIDWMIKKVRLAQSVRNNACTPLTYLQGEVIDPEKPITKDCFRDFLPTHKRTWTDTIVMTFNDPKDLPTYIGHGEENIDRVNSKAD